MHKLLKVAFILSFIFIIIIIISLYLLYSGESAQKNPKDPSQVPIFSTESQAANAVKEENPSNCEIIPDTKRKNVCLSDFHILMALKNEEISSCQKIPLEDVSQACKAIINKNPQACNEINGLWQEICLRFHEYDAVKHIQENDASFCNRLSDVKDFSVDYCTNLVLAQI